MLTHQGIGYYWKVRVNDDEMACSLSVIIGLEEKTSSFFYLLYHFKDPFLHFPMSGQKSDHTPESLKELKAREKISPRLIAEAIDVANQHAWETKRHFALMYADDAFTVVEHLSRQHL